MARFARPSVRPLLFAGNETATSDIDVMLVGEATSRFKMYVSSLAGAQRGPGREVNPAVHRTEEFRNLVCVSVDGQFNIAYNAARQMAMPL